MFKIARSLYALAYCGIYKYQDWQKWADKLILDNQELDLWIYDVSMAYDFNALSKAIGERMEQENWSEYPSYTITELILGGYYYMYKNNNITLYKLIERCGKVSDGGDAPKDCEYFYELMNEIDKQPTIEKSYGLQKELERYLEPLRQEIMARKNWIENCSYKDIII